MKPVFLLLLSLGAVGATEVARAQPLIAPPPALPKPTAAPGGLRLVSPWLNSGWDDGLAEVAEYQLQQFRYGNLHPGTTVLVAVRESMDAQRAVKAGPSANVTVPVLKLHTVRSFQTGVYRYDQSSFQLVRQADGLVLRWLITSQEWCGAAAKSWVNGGPLRVSSYFDGHGDLEQPLDLGSNAVPSDSLWWWTRAWVAAGMPGVELRVVPSQMEARCIDTTPLAASLSSERSEVLDPTAQPGRKVPAVVVSIRRGTVFDRLTISDDARHALLAWQQADGSQLTLLRLRRFDYWAHHDPADLPAQP